MREIRPGVIAVHWVNDVGATKSKIPTCETPGVSSGRQGHGNGRKATHHLRRPGGAPLANCCDECLEYYADTYARQEAA